MLRRAIKPVLIIVGVIAGATLIGRRLGYNFGPNTVVRCRKGHLFTTIWIPGVKLKELDLIVARIQRCPVGKHWSLVVPVKEANLTDEERQIAREDHEKRVPWSVIRTASRSAGWTGGAWRVVTVVVLLAVTVIGL